MGVSGVVPCGNAHVEHFFIGVLARFAGLSLDEVKALVAVFEEEVMETQDDRTAFAQRHISPRTLRLSGGNEGGVHIGLSAGRQCVEDVTGERLENVARRP
jgi:hypothetical protein